MTEETSKALDKASELIAAQRANPLAASTTDICDAASDAIILLVCELQRALLENLQLQLGREIEATPEAEESAIVWDKCIVCGTMQAPREIIPTNPNEQAIGVCPAPRCRTHRIGTRS